MRHGVAHKSAVVRRGLTRHADAFRDPLEVRRRVGAREIAAIVGALLAARTRGDPGAAALLHAQAPSVLNHVQAAHLLVEPGHAWLIKRLWLEPSLQLEMRLGEASGAALAILLGDLR